MKVPIPRNGALHKITMTPQELECVYGTNQGTLANLRSKKQGPPYILLGRKVLYRVDLFEKWLFAGAVKTIESMEEEG